MLPASIALASPPSPADATPAVSQSLRQALGEALGHRSYVLLMLGFFTCGFQLAFITVHLPAFLVDRGLSSDIGGWTLAAIGLFNIVGALGSGWLSGRMPKRYLLSLLYFGRAAAIFAFIMFPITAFTCIVFGATMGLMWLSTVPPTNGIIVVMFGTRWLAMLSGVTFFSHQVGGFLGVWLGGIVFDRTGSYDLVWWLAILFGVLSGLINLPIVEQPVARRGRRCRHDRNEAMATFKAIVVDKTDAGQTVRLTAFDDKDLMDGDVTVAVEYSTLNYKDGLALTGKSPVVRRFPMIAGIDFAGTVASSAHPSWKPGDKVILNGWGLGETHLGAYAEKARVKGDWLVRLPASMSARDAMAIGTAGYTAMLSVLALERGGITPARGSIVVTGAAGGVGSVAIALSGQARLSGDRFDRAAGGGRLSQAARRHRSHRAQGTGRPAAGARQGALGWSRRRGRFDHPGECALHGPLWRRRHRLRARRRNGLADHGGALHPARRFACRYRFGHVPAAASARGVAPIWKPISIAAKSKT